MGCRSRRPRRADRSIGTTTWAPTAWSSRPAQCRRPTRRSRLLTPSRACRKISVQLNPPDGKTSIRRLEPRFLEPDRSRLADVRALLVGVSGAAEAWAKVGFVSSRERWFRGRGALLSHPPTVEACALFACDRAGLEHAEELARTACARLARWRGDEAATTPRLIWRIQGAARAADHDGPTRFDVPGLESA